VWVIVRKLVPGDRSSPAASNTIDLNPERHFLSTMIQRYTHRPAIVAPTGGYIEDIDPEPALVGER
jgi:hypothetical protein